MRDDVASAALPEPVGETVLERFIDSLQWQSTVFHVGQYCGGWKASTAGRGLASFHLVLHGRCHLHRPGHASTPLSAGDAVFFLDDQAHHLSSDPDAQAHCLPQSMQPAMQPTWPVEADGTALACGFFEYRSALTAWLVRALPGPLLLPHDSTEPSLQAVRQLFELMRTEAALTTQSSTDRPSAALARLVDLLMLYLLRHAAHRSALTSDVPGLWRLLGQRDLAGLVEQLIRDPAADWSIERMAEVVHLSRAAFYRRFTQAAGEAPAQFLLRLRMALAADQLRAGQTVESAASQAGYQSTAAFHRAFTRIVGTLPGRYRHTHTQARSEASALTTHHSAH